MNIQPVEVDTIGVYCIKFLSSGNVELGGDYNQSQCVNTTSIPNGNGKYEAYFIVPNGNYVIPKIRVYKNSLEGFYKDFSNVIISCDPTTTLVPPTTATPTTTVAPTNFQISNLLWQPDDEEDDFLEIEVVSLGNGFIKFVDNGNNQGLNVYYKINGASNPVDARVLSQNPIPANEEVNILKYGYSPLVSNVNNPNSLAWRLYFDSNNPLPVKIASYTSHVYYNNAS